MLKRVDIVCALFVLNCHYGRGDIDKIDHKNGLVHTSAGNAGGRWTFRFRVVGNTVHYRGHQRTFKR